MAIGCTSKSSSDLCVFLCIYISLVGFKSLYLQNNTSLKDSDVYFVSQMNCRTEIVGNLRQRRKSSGDKQLSQSLKAVVLCKLFHRACFALALIALAGDIETNPGYQTLEDIRNTRGLKIAHLNIRSLVNKTDSLRLEGIDSKTVDILTLSETWLNGVSAMPKLLFPDLCAFVMTVLALKKDMVVF